MSTPDNTSRAAGKYLTVLLAHEAYGIPVLQVREIIRLQKITPMPHTPEYVRGVINLRGRVIPVVDLRVKFGLDRDLTEHTCIIVVQVRLASDLATPMGLVVDAVEEVVNLTADHIEPAPDFGVQIDTACLLGVARVNDQVKMLLNIDQVVAPDTVHALAAAS